MSDREMTRNLAMFCFSLWVFLLLISFIVVKSMDGVRDLQDRVHILEMEQTHVRPQ